MTMITPSYLGETIEYSSLHACRSTLEDPTRKRITPVIQKRRYGAIVPDIFPDQPVQLERRRARLQHLGYFRERFADQQGAIPHQLDFSRSLIMNHNLTNLKTRGRLPS